MSYRRSELMAGLTKKLVKEEALRLTGGDELMPNFWVRYSIYLAIAGITLAIMISIFSPR